MESKVLPRSKQVEEGEERKMEMDLFADVHSSNSRFSDSSHVVAHIVLSARPPEYGITTATTDNNRLS